MPVLRKQIGFLILTWVRSLGPQHSLLCHCCSLHWLTLLWFTGQSRDKAQDTSVLHMAMTNPLSDRWLNPWVMILFLFICKCFHFNEMEIPYSLYSKLMSRVSVIRSFFLQFKGQENKKKKKKEKKENLLFILSLCWVTTRMVVFNKKIEIFMPEGLRFYEVLELW